MAGDDESCGECHSVAFEHWVLMAVETKWSNSRHPHDGRLHRAAVKSLVAAEQ
ncbi:MAG: hypothetical protein WB565_08150 [Acidimicrobiales bacterium]